MTPGYTNLMLASGSGGDESEVRKLIKAGADVNAKNNKGITALMLATVFDKNNIIKILIKAGANINAKDNTGFTALMWASTKAEYVWTAESLIEAGANLNVKDNKGMKALKNLYQR